jgi:hypothetical protein
MQFYFFQNSLVEQEETNRSNNEWMSNQVFRFFFLNFLTLFKKINTFCSLQPFSGTQLLIFLLSISI